MSGMEHTPGPWYPQDDIEGNPGVRAKSGFICFAPHVAHYPGQDRRYQEEIEERKANAALIAAAPDLLTALRAIIDYDGKDGVPGIEALCELGRAAIAKAEGKEAPHA